MPFNRRRFLASSASTGLAALTPLKTWAETSLSAGEGTLTVLSDGHLTLPKSMILGEAPEAEATDILGQYGLSGDMLEPDCNITILQRGDRTVLFDVGAGSNFMASAGRLLDGLYDAGIDPFDVTDVVFTHAHPDHLWGLLDDFDDLAYPDAQFHIGQTEWDYWTDPDTVDTIGEERAAFAVGAQSRLALLEDRINLLADGAEVLPGVISRLTPGHTPGHMAFEVDAGGESVMILGDCIGNHHIAFERPNWAAGSDQDPELGAATRTALLDQLATERTRIIGFHLPSDGIGYVERQGETYHFTADAG